MIVKIIILIHLRLLDFSVGNAFQAYTSFEMTVLRLPDKINRHFDQNTKQSGVLQGEI